MSLYFFHIRDTLETIDNDGIELATSDDACTEVIVSAGEILTDYRTKFWSGPELRVWMTDELGSTVFALCISAEDEFPKHLGHA